MVEPLVHIRHPPSRARRGSQWYRAAPDRNDPARTTLCGEPPAMDMTFAETRHVKARGYVTCTECLRIRLNALNGTNL